MIRFFISLFLDKINSDVSNNISNVILDSFKFKNKTCLRKKIKINKIKKKRRKRKSRWGKSEIELLNEEANRKCERKRVVLAGQSEMKQTILKAQLNVEI